MPPGSTTRLAPTSGGPDPDDAFTATSAGFEVTQVKRGGNGRGNGDGGNNNGNNNGNGDNRNNDGNNRNNRDRERDGLGLPGLGNGGPGFSAEMGFGGVVSGLMGIPGQVWGAATEGGVMGFIMDSFKSSGSAMGSGYPGTQSIGPRTPGRRSSR
ncbi:hypothetical protein [Marinitenerispora sediminis]|uniref:Uncharacterized protein n=1 Tax=Marinitenerispora sediminis TaxID=1931232 RepID=A0A368T5U3_9ACTN|nr:hypothetical protein [Marinitenerispora sediminis]RCV53239.1 hypothetical protein DEF28_10910 [Marinitenerispora sediminis]RCV54938.1 hypothetical protein DEF23_15055 [Marinitenerispora sediminis]RCV59061.1 hypothetical protein DEF24_11190 [Marinitenerispora sediminis]